MLSAFSALSPAVAWCWSSTVVGQEIKPTFLVCCKIAAIQIVFLSFCCAWNVTSLEERVQRTCSGNLVGVRSCWTMQWGRNLFQRFQKDTGPFWPSCTGSWCVFLSGRTTNWAASIVLWWLRHVPVSMFVSFSVRSIVAYASPILLPKWSLTKLFQLRTFYSKFAWRRPRVVVVENFRWWKEWTWE